MFRIFIPIFFFALSLLSGSSVLAETIYRVQGKILQSDGTPPKPISVHLMEIAMSDVPSIQSVQVVETDQTGFYQLQYSPKTNSSEKFFYRVSVDLAGRPIGSEPFRFEGKKQPLQIDLTLPSVITSSQGLEVPKEILIFEGLEGRIRVTNIVLIVNQMDALVDAKKIPFEKPIPKAAFNIQSIDVQDDVEMSVEPGIVNIGVAMTKGTKQVLFSYDLPVSGRNLDLDYKLMPGLQEIEFASPEKNFGIEVSNFGGNVLETIKTTKRVGGRAFYSTVVPLGEGVNVIPLSLTGIPFNQSSLIIPGVFLFVILIAGLAVYLVKKKKLQTSGEA